MLTQVYINVYITLIPLPASICFIICILIFFLHGKVLQKVFWHFRFSTVLRIFLSQKFFAVASKQFRHSLGFQFHLVLKQKIKLDFEFSMWKLFHWKIADVYDGLQWAQSLLSQLFKSNSNGYGRTVNVCFTLLIKFTLASSSCNTAILACEP